MITVREFLEDINEEVKNHPELLDMPIIYATDDEGNDFHLVCSNTTKVFYENSDTHYGINVTVSSEEETNDEFNALLIN